MPSRPARLSAHEAVFQDETVERTAPGLPPTPDLLAMLSPEHPGAGSRRGPRDAFLTPGAAQKAPRLTQEG